MRFANMEEGLDKIKWSLQYIFACVTYTDDIFRIDITNPLAVCKKYKFSMPVQFFAEK